MNNVTIKDQVLGQISDMLDECRFGQLQGKVHCHVYRQIQTQVWAQIGQEVRVAVRLQTWLPVLIQLQPCAAHEDYGGRVDYGPVLEQIRSQIKEAG
jgi:hypothetical protein